MTKTLIDTYHDMFTTEFEGNKKAVDELAITEVKKLRNKIAGYITRRMVIVAANRPPRRVPRETKTKGRQMRGRRR